MRREWLRLGLATSPADRPVAEAAITEIYARHRRSRPRFVWVASPRAALPHLRGLPTHETLREWLTDRCPPGTRPLASDVAAGLSHLRSESAATYTEPAPERPPLKRRKGEAWPSLPPDRALDAGLPFQELLRQGVADALFRSLSAVYLPVRAAAGPLPVGWYGSQDAAWVAHLDIQQRLGLAHPRAGFSAWATLVRAAGWWWPGESVCVLSERPEAIHTEPVPGAWHDEIRPRHFPDRPSVVYRDGWSVPA
jgi:hypothetical protein